MDGNLKLECPNCQVEYVPERELTIVVVYDEPEYNHLLTRCPECEHKLMLFFDNPAMLTLGYMVQHNFHPPERVKEVYHSIMAPEPQGEEPDVAEQPTKEIELPVTVEPFDLTPRLQGECLRFEEVLATIPDDLLFDALTAGAGKRDVPPGKTNLPRNWR